jgi:hypothetical protein
MAYTWNDLLSMVDPVVHRLVKDRQAATVCNRALLEIWDEYDWRESLAEHDPWYLIPARQDYPSPFSATPSDFRGLRKTYLIYTAGDPPVYQPLNVLRNLEPTLAMRLPEAISYEPSISGYRVFPRPPRSMGSPDWMIGGTYKKEPARVTNGTLAGSTPFADDFLEALLQGIKWAAFDLAGDQRAGGTQVQDNFKVHTGQYGNFMAAIAEIAGDYGLDDGDHKVSPSEPLAVTGYNGGGWPGGLFR